MQLCNLIATGTSFFTYHSTNSKAWQPWEDATVWAPVELGRETLGAT